MEYYYLEWGMVMDLKNLATFIHVAELNSFTKAAAVLGYSQSTVSFQIRQLETELNAQLFERIDHTVALTEKGREVLNYAHRIRRMTMELTENMADQQELKGHIRLAMADSFYEPGIVIAYSSYSPKFIPIKLLVHILVINHLLFNRYRTVIRKNEINFPSQTHIPVN